VARSGVLERSVKRDISGSDEAQASVTAKIARETRSRQRRWAAGKWRRCARSWRRHHETPARPITALSSGNGTLAWRALLHCQARLAAASSQRCCCLGALSGWRDGNGAQHLAPVWRRTAKAAQGGHGDHRYRWRWRQLLAATPPSRGKRAIALDSLCVASGMVAPSQRARAGDLGGPRRAQFAPRRT